MTRDEVKAAPADISGKKRPTALLLFEIIFMNPSSGRPSTVRRQRPAGPNAPPATPLAVPL